jgi:hypothetical protein
MKKTLIYIWILAIATSLPAIETLANSTRQMGKSDNMTGVQIAQLTPEQRQIRRKNRRAKKNGVMTSGERRRQNLAKRLHKEKTNVEKIPEAQGSDLPAAEIKESN